MENWQKLPNVMFAKAWYLTGHIEKEEAMRVGQISEEEWSACSMLHDPAGMADIMGEENVDEPSIPELIASGRSNRQRVVWLINPKPGVETFALLPGILIYPLEKRLCYYLFHKAKGGEGNNKPKSTLVMSRRTSKDMVGVEAKLEIHTYSTANIETKHR